MREFFSDTVSFVLRGGDEAFVYENFPRAGYGFFIVFLYIFVLPSPVVYYYLRDRKAAQAATKIDDDDELVFSNPLPGSDESLSGSVDDLGGIGLDGADTKDSNAPAVPRAALAKLQREAKEARKNQGDVVAEAKAQRAEIDSLKAENKRLQGEVISAGMGASAASAEMMAAAKAQADAAAEAQVQANTELHRWDTRRPSQVLAVQGLVQEGILTEESITEAKKTLALQFELQGKQQRSYTVTQMIEAQMDQMRQRTPVAFAARSSLSDWLDKHRLTRHELQIIAMAGPETALGDLMLLDEEDVAELCSAMTKVEARRFEAALKANADDKPDSADDDAEDQVSAIAEGSSQKKLSSSKKSTMTSSQL